MTVLSVSHVSKKYAQQLRRALWYGVRDIACELLARGNHRDAHPLRAGEFWALDDVSFALGRGESLAIVGHNGAGKSTLLRVLYGLLKPDRGEVRLQGRAETLIELGTGFHPLLTGRENVRLGAALYGLTPRQTAELYEKVVDFAELGDFLDAPVQSYSSGMRARLGYAIAAHLEPDVLMVDEVLAVGDLAFQRKCATHMRAYLNRGGSLLLVSHNTFQIQAVCERGILLDRGRVAFSGTAVETLNAMFEKRLVAGAPRQAAVPAAIGPAAIEDLLVEPIQSDAIRAGEPVRITVRYRIEETTDVLWGFDIWTPDQWICVAGEYDTTSRTIPAGQGELTCVIPRLPLVGGRYAVRAALLDVDTGHPIALYGVYDAPVTLDVRSNAGKLSNTKMTLNQLVTIDVDWR